MASDAPRTGVPSADGRYGGVSLAAQLALPGMLV